MDGQLLKLDKSNFHSDEDNLKVKGNDSVAHIGIKGGEYGEYKFSIDVPDLDDSIQVTVMQFNWWNVTDFYLDVEIDTVKHNILYSYSYTWIAEGVSPPVLLPQYNI